MAGDPEAHVPVGFARAPRCFVHPALPNLFRKRRMTLLAFLLWPSNLVCDRLGLTDQHERGMMRMFVNMCLFSGLCVVAFFVLWTMLA